MVANPCMHAMIDLPCMCSGLEEVCEFCVTHLDLEGEFMDMDLAMKKGQLEFKHEGVAHWVSRGGVCGGLVWMSKF